MFKRILTATDMILTADAPVLAAAVLARQHQAPLFLLHVMESASTENRRWVRHFETNEELTADPAYEQMIGQQLENTYKSYLDGITYQVGIRSGFPWEEILRWSRQVDSDLIVLGPHSSRAEEKGVVRITGRVGSTVENVVTRERCPVMIVNQTVPESGWSLRRIMVGVDFSTSCESAVHFTAALATHYRCHVSVLHMIPIPPYPKYSRDNYNADLLNTRKRLASSYDGLLENIDHEYVIRAGALPHQEILKGADQHAVDLIILGSHTKERAGKWYPGSVVERVGYRSPCPVLVITDPDVLLRWEDDRRGAEDGDIDAKDHLIHVFTGH